MPTNLLKYLVKVKGLPGPAGNWQDNIRIPMLWRICLNQWEKNSWHGRAQLLLLSIEMISQNLLKSFQMIPRNWNSYTLLYLPQSYEKEKKYPWNGWNTECQLFPSLNEIHILMKLDEMGNQVSRCMLYCVWAFISNCPWHFNSQILLWCNILHERILDIFVSIIGRRAKCQRGRHEKHLCGNIIHILWEHTSNSMEIHFISYGNIFFISWNIFHMFRKISSHFIEICSTFHGNISIERKMPSW